MYDDKNAAGVGVGPILPFSHTPNNYTPSPIDRLTTHSVDQRILATLERIETLLMLKGPHQTPIVPYGDPRHHNYEPSVPPETGKRGGKRSPTK